MLAWLITHLSLVILALLRDCVQYIFALDTFLSVFIYQGLGFQLLKFSELQPALPLRVRQVLLQSVYPVGKAPPL